MKERNDQRHQHNQLRASWYISNPNLKQYISDPVFKNVFAVCSYRNIDVEVQRQLLSSETVADKGRLTSISSSGLSTPYSTQTRLADILVTSQTIGKAAALEITVVNPLNPANIADAQRWGL